MTKCIITGFTADMARGTSRVGFESMSLALVRMCEQLGWNVSHQPMMVDSNDDDLREADVMFMGIAPFNAVGSRYLFGAMDAIGKARRNNCAMVFYVTDYQTHLLNSSIKTMLKKPYNLAKFFMRARTDYTWGAHNIDYLEMILRTFHDYPWPETIVPVHTWFDQHGSGKKLVEHIPARRLCFIDPTEFTTKTWKHPEFFYQEKQRQYVMAALGDYSRWITDQNLGWPVQYFGGKTHIEDPENPEKRVVNKRITEVEVNQQYAQSWVGLAPKHSLSGSAWWRTRYDFILSNGAILYGEPQETWPIGDAFQLTIPQIESLDTHDLMDLQITQKKQFDSRVESPASVLESVLGATQRAFDDIGKAVL